MATYDTDHLRNVVLLSHSGAGKTILSEAALFTTKATTRLGRVEDETTTSDYEPESTSARTAFRRRYSRSSTGTTSSICSTAPAMPITGAR